MIFLGPLRSSTLVKSNLANAVKRQADPATVDALRVEHRASRAAEYLRRLVAEAPPLTADQISELQGILSSAASYPVDRP